MDELERVHRPAIRDKSSDTRSGPPSGFGKGVNDYLNHFVTVADAKAGLIAAVSVAMVVGLSEGTNAPDAADRAALGFLLLAIAICGAVIFPRLPSGSTSLIFWEDIRRRGSRSDYARAVSELDEEAVEREYGSQNWYVSCVLSEKHQLIRWAAVIFGVGTMIAMAQVVLR